MTTITKKTGTMLDEQMDSPFELCHFECINKEIEDSEGSLTEEMGYSQAYLTHIFSCYQATENPEVLTLLENIGVAVTQDQLNANFDLDSKDATGYALSEEAWEELGGFYVKGGFDVYVSETMMEVY